jgi:hypothetical protein
MRIEVHTTYHDEVDLATITGGHTSTALSEYLAAREGEDACQLEFGVVALVVGDARSG